MKKRVRISKEAVEAIFETARDQGEYIIGIFNLVFPDWDRIEHIDGYVKCNEHTAGAIMRMAMAWDQKHTNAMSGGAWMNYGFSTYNGDDLPNWTVSLCDVTVHRKAAA